MGFDDKDTKFIFKEDSNFIINSNGWEIDENGKSDFFYFEDSFFEYIDGGMENE